MSKSISKELLEHKKRQNTNRITLNDLYEYELDLVFCRSNGKAIPSSTLFHAFRSIQRNMKAENILSIHSLRHTHAVLMLESGADMKFIQERLGHGSIQITSDVYSHISKKMSNEAIHKFEEYTKTFL